MDLLIIVAYGGEAPPSLAPGQRRVHTDNAAADAMFLILRGNRATNGEHEGVNRAKMRHNRDLAAG